MIDVGTKPAPVEVVTPLRPSEAIRLGCLIAPVQAFGAYVGEGGKACAIGAGMLGMGLPLPSGPGDFEDILGEHDERFPYHCPAAGCIVSVKSELVVHLNDDHRWTRERIADWLEGLGL